MKVLAILRRLVPIIGLMSAVTAFDASHSIMSTTVCMPNDGLATTMVAKFQTAMTTTDTLKIHSRAYMQLPSVPVSQVTYLTNNKTCNSAAAAYNAALVQPPPYPPSGSVYVWQIGTVYVVLDTAQRVGEWRTAMTLDKHFSVLVKYTL